MSGTMIDGYVGARTSLTFYITRQTRNFTTVEVSIDGRACGKLRIPRRNVEEFLGVCFQGFCANGNQTLVSVAPDVGPVAFNWPSLSEVIEE